ncbi:hypothetical protein D3C85_1091850 [compost metagenome]
MPQRALQAQRPAFRPGQIHGAGAARAGSDHHRAVACGSFLVNHDRRGALPRVTLDCPFAFIRNFSCHPVRDTGGDGLHEQSTKRLSIGVEAALHEAKPLAIGRYLKIGPWRWRKECLYRINRRLGVGGNCPVDSKDGTHHYDGIGLTQPFLPASMEIHRSASPLLKPEFRVVSLDRGRGSTPSTRVLNGIPFFQRKITYFPARCCPFLFN